MEYKYDIIRSPRKSISITISNRNQITVRCPWGMSENKIKEYLNSKSEWINKVINKNALRLAVNDDIMEKRCVYFNGVKLPLILSDKNVITPEAVYVKKYEDIGNLYKKHCSDEFFNAVDVLSKLTRLTPNSIGIRKYRGRWGCCDSKNNLVFNYILFMLPPKVQRYVIIHELCHILCHNHSPAFWKLVSDFEPNYKRLKKQLADFGFLIDLY
ncbi:MAG: M48 family metallopeptidase [Clostridiales bacterium]|nr:M48 family metallopeptidase [Clostridiales bacterium]